MTNDWFSKIETSIGLANKWRLVHTYEQIYGWCKRTFLELIVVAVTDKW